jgi:DNA-directed RNA polymerase specialized sigma24 family protein
MSTGPALSAGASTTGGLVLSNRGFSQFFQEQWSDLVGYCSSLVGDRAVGEELAQEAFTRLYVRFGALREPRPYCFRVATNLARDHIKRVGREQVTADIIPLGAYFGVDPHLLDAVHRLPRRQTEVVLLHYFADLTVDEVAAVLRRPRGTVGRQLAEARAALSQALKETP